jgi:hypothetical protein
VLSVILTNLLPLAVILGIWIFFIGIMRKQQAGPGAKPHAGVCQVCGTAAPAKRRPHDFQEFMWGGWTCETCLTTVDRMGVARPGIGGRPVSQPLPPFWQAATNYLFVWIGGLWGFLMWIIMVLIPGIITGIRTGGFDTGRLLLGFAVCAVGGVLFGGAMYLVMRPLRTKKRKDPSDLF